MTSYLFPLRYLKLEGQSGAKLIRRDIIPTILIVLALSAPFIFFSGANYTHDDGFLDRLGSFCAVLTGFYFAGLIAVASLSSEFADLDKPITVGEVRAPSRDGDQGEILTRREYVCHMFSYMSFLSIIISGFSISVVLISDQLNLSDLSLGNYEVSRDYVRAGFIVLFSIPLSSLLLTTLRGLYYLSERLYYEEGKIDNSTGPDGGSVS